MELCQLRPKLKWTAKHTPQKSAHISAVQNATSDTSAVNIEHFSINTYRFYLFLINKGFFDAHNFWLLQTWFWNYFLYSPCPPPKKSQINFWKIKTSGCFARTISMGCDLEHIISPILMTLGQFLLIHACVGTVKKVNPFAPSNYFGR